jgi:hypothetical protein
VCVPAEACRQATREPPADGTIVDLLRPQVIDEALASSGAGPAEADSTKADGFALTEDEERELAELMGDD